MFNASLHTLKLLASLIWYSGFIVLFIKGGKLLLEAEKLSPGQAWTWLALLAGLGIGIIKAKYLYSKLCIKNLARINALQQPKIWHFYRLRFFVFLCLMVVLGLFLSRYIQGNYPMLITMAILELSIATALLGSSHYLWNELKNR
ncbi:MAG: hypothetical protein OQK32_03130 [Gammaproteobacteria bacterium]|nr:hypothetical protein [Gammaproteobacteria bacterium]MCW8922348.1 hypothetical protein [Gammaproteobacteria bacterium]